jgi:hypothetical protein
MLHRAKIQEQVTALARKINAPSTVLPTFDHARDDGTPYVEIDQAGYHWVIKERGQEQQRRTTRDPDELLYWIFSDVTWQMALEWALAHRLERQDDRRLSFPYQEALLATLSPAWSTRAAQRHATILQRHPYDDDAGVRARLTKAYRDQGYAPDVAWSLAREPYPLPTE